MRRVEGAWDLYIGLPLKCYPAALRKAPDEYKYHHHPVLLLPLWDGFTYALIDLPLSAAIDPSRGSKISYCLVHGSPIFNEESSMWEFHSPDNGELRYSLGLPDERLLEKWQEWKSQFSSMDEFAASMSEGLGLKKQKNELIAQTDNISATDDYKGKMEELINQTYPGLTMHVRDVNLPSEIARKYVPGLIIREKAYTDASCRVMGMITTHRFAILSNHMADFQAYEHGTNWGLCVANRDSHFKVMATYEYCGKMLIILLHLPDNESWKMFVDTVLSIDEEIIASSIERFKNKCSLEAIPELTSDAWLERCSFPIGMDADGNFFELE